jgi:hypothetical protein
MLTMTVRGVGEEFARFAATQSPRAPLYGRLASSLSDWPGLDALFAGAPEPARRAVSLFAAVHYLLLDDREAPLARFYRNLAGADVDTGDPVPEFIAYCEAQADEVGQLLATRLPQTNEIGRSALLVVALASLFEEVGALAQLDVGASAGLNLLADRFSYAFGDRVLGDGRVRLDCGIRGPARPKLLPNRLPVLSARLGLDRNPIDLADADGVRWLEACVWPDQPDRFARLVAAIDVARSAGVRVRPGDAVADLAPALAELGPGHPVITTSWVLAYLEPDSRTAFMDELDALGAQRDLSWISLEDPSATPGLRWPAEFADGTLTVLRLVRWRGGRRREDFLAECHPHGYWLRWL